MPCDWPILICWSSESTVSSDSLRVQCSLGVSEPSDSLFSHLKAGNLIKWAWKSRKHCRSWSHSFANPSTFVPSCSSTCSNLVWCWPSQLETLPYCKWAFICFRGREMTRTRRAITSLTSLACSFSGAPRRAHCGSRRSWSLPVWVETTKGCLYRFFLLNEKEQVQDVHTNHQKWIHTSMYYIYIYIIIIYQLDCNSGPSENQNIPPKWFLKGC